MGLHSQKNIVRSLCHGNHAGDFTKCLLQDFTSLNGCRPNGSLQRFKPLKDHDSQATFSSRSSTNTDSLGVSRFLEPAGKKIVLVILVRMVWLQILWARSTTHHDIRLKNISNVPISDCPTVDPFVQGVKLSECCLAPSYPLKVSKELL